MSRNRNSVQKTCQENTTIFHLHRKPRRRQVDTLRCANPGAVVRSSMHIIAPLLLLAVTQAADVPQPTALPGGFVDTTGKIGVFSTPNGGVQAIELATGKVIFQSKRAQRPLFLVGDRLVALAAVHAPVARGLCFEWQAPWDGPRNGFRFVTFDLAKVGEIVQVSETVALPEWASIVDAHDRSFAIRWHTADGRLILTWQAKSRHAEPTDEKQATGAVRFDLKTAGFDTLPAQ